MRRLATIGLIAVLLSSLSIAPPRAAGAAGPAAPAITYPLPPGVRFAYVAANPTIAGNTSRITHPNAANTSTAFVFATHNYSAYGAGGPYNNREVGVYYGAVTLSGLGPAGFVGNWFLFHEDSSAFTEDAAYNIMIAPPGERLFFHTSSITNTASNSTYIDHPTLAGRLDRILFVQHNQTPNGTPSGPQITQTVGVWYNPLLEQWAIFTQDDTPMPANVTFNVMIGLPGANVFTHTATVTNTAFNYTVLDHPLANNNPNAVILVTQVWNPTGTLVGVYNPQPIGVYYDVSTGRWNIFNEDQFVDMPVGASFSVLINEAEVFLPLSLR